MDLGLKGKRALVLGGSRGLGKAIGAALAAEGARVLLCSRDPQKLAAAQRETGAAGTLALDLDQPGAAREAVERAQRELSGLDVLVCNTGGPPKAEFTQVSGEQWQKSFQSLWLAAVDAMNASLPAMRAQKWGRILLVTSVSARENLPALAISNSLRAGLLGLCKTASREVAADGVTINCLLPGFTRTERMTELGLTDRDVAGQVPAGRMGEPDEFGAAAAFLASSRASYITGQALAVDGGWLRGA